MADDDVTETGDLLRRAWEAVERSGVPESMQDAAFKEAVEDLRLSGASGATASDRANESGSTKKKRRQPSSRAVGIPIEEGSNGSTIDEATFFARLSAESGVDEKDLRDVLNLAGDKVHVTPPTRELGASTAEQAKTVIPLVAGARSFGLGERPVSSKAVREELDRKRCYQSKKFAGRHLAPLRGFNFGASPAHIVTTSRWVDEFAAAVNRALGRTREEDES